jgi:D-alanyl-lipoteichoic acid acyltransferase DltB (MBOAT superfamily)
VFLIYFLLRQHNWKILFLLGASLYFYGSWKPTYLLLILLTTIVSYFVALTFDRPFPPVRKKLLLVTALIINLGILFIFKYLGFFNYTLDVVLSWFGFTIKLPDFKLLLPVGISFYTFQSIGYLVDVYRGKTKPEKNLAIFTLFITFFPQLVAGPIERSQHLLPQFRVVHRFSYSKSTSGLKLIALGLFKKIVVADNLALAVNAVYNAPGLIEFGQYKGLSLILATFFFSWQIFCDFSGYTDIARGSARLLGFNLMENFRMPYLATSITDFWRRWHISLSTWFKDYVYIPLGGNRHGLAHTCLNLFIIFLLCGLWHGANWTFVLWGAYFGIIIALERLWFTYKKVKLSTFKLPLLFKIIYVNILVLIGWVLFRANNLADAIYIYQNMFKGFKNFLSPSYIWATLMQLFDNNRLEMGIAAFCVLAIIGIEVTNHRMGLGKFEHKLPTGVRWFAYLFLIASIIILRQSNIQEFIYFQF